MKRFRRWLLNSITAVPLLVSVACLTLYFRLQRLDSIYFQTAGGRLFAIDFGPHWICFYWSLPNRTTDRGWYLWHMEYNAWLDFPKDSVWNRIGFWHYHQTIPELFTTAFMHNGADRVSVQDQIYLPVWFISAVCGVIPLTLIGKRTRIIYATLAGRCPECGYDLRATPDRCPECGTVPTKTELPSR
jgi:hypothetical protein